MSGAQLMKRSVNSIRWRLSNVQAGDGFHIHDVFAMAIGKPNEQIMGQNNPDKDSNLEQETFKISAETEKRIFGAETYNPSIDSERETTSRTVAKEGTEDNQRENKEETVPTTVSPEKIFLKNGSLCGDTSPSSALRDR